MKKNYKNQGFTLIEIIIVVAIFGLIISFGMIVDLNFLKGDAFRNEQYTIISVLEKARSRAMANFFESPHGVCYIAPNYVIFRENDGNCNPSVSSNELIPTNTNVVATFPTIVFSQLTGNLIPQVSDTEAPCPPYEKKITIAYQGKESNICINNEGTINW